METRHNKNNKSDTEMELIILRKDPTWTIKVRHSVPGQSPGLPIGQVQLLRQRFHEIAHRHGSHATWLPETGFLVTDDLAEPAREFPYEVWLMQAQRETGDGARSQPPMA